MSHFCRVFAHCFFFMSSFNLCEMIIGSACQFLDREIWKILFFALKWSVHQFLKDPSSFMVTFVWVSCGSMEFRFFIAILSSWLGFVICLLRLCRSLFLLQIVNSSSCLLLHNTFFSYFFSNSFGFASAFA